MHGVLTRLRGSGPLALFLSPSNEPLELDLRLLGRLWGLTPTEGRVAASLAESESIAKAAAELAIRPETAKSHLKQIFQKTGVRRQNALTRLICGGLATLRLPE